MLLFSTLVAPLTSPAQRHWKETDSETLWTLRYSNCDYGYYVLLPNGFVAHNSLPPAPNHGFIVSLPDVGTRSYLGDRNERFVWVDASYNTGDSQKLSDVVGSSLKDEGGPGKILKRIPIMLAGIPAIRVKMEHASGKSRFLQEETIAVRSGIVYTIGLRTSHSHSNLDERTYDQILEGFQFQKLPRGECSNG